MYTPPVQATAGVVIPTNTTITTRAVAAITRHYTQQETCPGRWPTACHHSRPSVCSYIVSTLRHAILFVQSVVWFS